jgi:serine/threonine-protein kinase
LERLLGRGGMGEVYLAEQLELHRRVVIKLLAGPQFSDARLEARFKREARALAQLNHPNIVHVYTFGREDDGFAYLAMEFIDGRTLASVVAESGVLPEPKVLAILDQLCEALAHAHHQGIVHRDLKPDNVMLVKRGERTDMVKVLDFGIAKLMRMPELRITHKGEVLGTPLYMAPEQLREGGADERSDVYALGVIAYELLTGTLPFEAASPLEVLSRVLREAPRPPRRTPRGANVSQELEAVIMRCMAKDPAARYQSAEALREAFASVARPQLRAAEATPAGPTLHEGAPRAAASLSLTDTDRVPVLARRQQTRARRRRSRAPLLAALAATLSLSLVAAAVHWLSGPAPASSTLAPLPLREWVQGIPFPEGTHYVKFEPLLIDARVPADPERVLAFYKQHLAPKWGGARALADGLVFESPLAGVEMLSVTPERHGSRVVITRRPATAAKKE